MQRPTLQKVRIRTPRDAMQVFNGVARGVIPLITRRLDVEERRAIIPGNVYVWEERSGTAEDESVVLGMERWTDGVSWGPSRVRDRFLYYYEKDIHTESSGSHNPFDTWNEIVRAAPGRHQDGRPGSPFVPFRRRTDSERLIKQTYSVFVNLPHDGDRGPRKWHITAYFSQESLGDLRTVDDIPGVGDVPVPEGWFVSARSRKSRRPGSSSGAPTGLGPASLAGGNIGGPPAESATKVNSNSSAAPPSHHQLRAYRQPSPPSDPPTTPQFRRSSPRRSSSSHPYYRYSPPSSTESTRARYQLVPLEYLQSQAKIYPRRDASDETTLLRLFTHASKLA